ncbi:MAG: hypothetical protein GXO62_08250 [Epsilonproteobacteria bacterium]|nr:hypothetical protein [Campylobacterota bacterium]
MNLKIFTTSRQIRKWLENKNDMFLDKYMTLGEFLEKIVIVEGAKFIDRDLRKKYLFEAIKNVDVQKLGISREFVDFFADSDFIFSFFNEVYLEGADIDDVMQKDIYQDFEEHLSILKDIFENYKNLLEKNGYIDRFLINEYKINTGLLDGIDRIELRLDGYLNKFDLGVLKKINKDLFIYFEVDKFNKPLLKKALGVDLELKEGYFYEYHLNTSKITDQKVKPKNGDIEIYSFSQRLNQVNFVFAKISEFIKSGISPQNIAVILPDEEFSEFLRLFDEFKNLNFAMGESFKNSDIYIMLKAIYDYINTNDEVAYKKIEDVYEEYLKEDLIDFIKKRASSNEMRVIDEELFKIEKFRPYFKDKKEFLYFVLEKLKNKSFDDTYSGKITVMGVLESRGIEFDGVIVLDFNEGIVPNVSSNDMFLNTFIREKSDLPTRSDKENLQKHYYYQLLHNAKKAAISFVKNEETSGSRFLYELGLELPEKNSDILYSQAVLKHSKEKEPFVYNKRFEIKEPIYPTTLKTLLECPRKYYFSKILEIQNPQDDNEMFGNIFHASIEEVVKNKDFINSKQEYFEALIKSVTSKISDKTLLFRVLVEWEDKIREFCFNDFEEMKYSKNLIERWIEFEFGGRKLKAKVDRIDIKEKEVVLIDYKTSKNSEEFEKYYPYEFQSTFYHLWAKNVFKKDIKTYIWDLYDVKKIEGNIKTDELKEALNTLPDTSLPPKDITYYVGKREKTKKASEICIYCEYKTACGEEI